MTKLHSKKWVSVTFQCPTDLHERLLNVANRNPLDGKARLIRAALEGWLEKHEITSKVAKKDTNHTYSK